jgi:hypothetical protein
MMADLTLGILVALVILIAHRSLQAMLVKAQFQDEPCFALEITTARGCSR